MESSYKIEAQNSTDDGHKMFQFFMSGGGRWSPSSLKGTPLNDS